MDDGRISLFGQASWGPWPFAMLAQKGHGGNALGPMILAFLAAQVSYGYSVLFIACSAAVVAFS
jgi:hypothetical protein